MLKIVEAGIVTWAVALVVTLVVPALHEGDRDWWPDVRRRHGSGRHRLASPRRGRGNAKDAA